MKASAPGKIILFGEHAVVYGRPALAIPVTEVHADVEVLDSARAGIWIQASDVNLHAELNTLPSDHPLASVVHNFLFLFRVNPFPNLEIKISSTIPIASGLGSGAAVTVALTRALSSFLARPMADEEVNAFAYEIEKLHHGTPSGIDNTVITYARPVYFVKQFPSLIRAERTLSDPENSRRGDEVEDEAGRGARGEGNEVETFKVGKPFTLVIGDTGISAPTKESVGDVRKLWEADKSKWENVFDRVGKIAEEARKDIESGKWEMLGKLMDQNHTLLQEMTVSSPELDRLVSAARSAGALGAKLSGGGRGGNMIALVNVNLAETFAKSMLEAGAKRVIITQVS